MRSHNVWTERLEELHPPRLHDSLLKVVGNTPLVRLNRLTAHLPASVEVWVKLENMNPSGSSKDRPARQIMVEAIARGELGSDKTLIDASSGNTGIAYAMIGASLGIDVHLVMPANVSEQRKRLVQIYGATIIESDPVDGMDGAIRLVREIVAQDTAGRYFHADQYGNLANPRSHELTTAPEIWRQTNGGVTHFLASIGSSGTIMGTGRGLKKFNPTIQVIGCQLADSRPGMVRPQHGPSSVVPAIYREQELDRVMWIETEDGRDMAQRVAQKEGIAAGNSAGANVLAALEVASTLESGVVVTVICDHADQYLDLGV